MPNFIDNLVHKARGSSLLIKPEPSLIPDFEAFSQNSVLPGKSYPDEKLTIESSQDFPANSDESISASKTTSEKFSSTSGIKFYASSEETSQKPFKKTNIDVARIPIQPQSEIYKINKRIKNPPEPFQSGPKVSSTSVEFSPAAEQQSSNLRDAEKMNLGKTVEHSRTSTSEFDRIPKPQPTPNDTDNKFPVYQSAPEMQPAKDKSSLSGKDEIHAVTVEPNIESRQQAFIKDLITKTNCTAPSSAVNGRDAKTTKSPHHKEVRVNIGRVEIKASRSTSPPVKSAPRGFEDHLMDRVYLNRHYF